MGKDKVIPFEKPGDILEDPSNLYWPSPKGNFPKRTDFLGMTDSELANAVKMLNHRQKIKIRRKNGTTKRVPN